MASVQTTLCLAVVFALALGSHAIDSAVGSSAVAKIMENCVAAEIDGFSYSADGSGAGQDYAVAAPGNIGVSDVPLSASGILHCPFATGIIRVVANNKEGLKLDACTLAGIFDGSITKWSDKAIVALNGDMADTLTGKIVPIGRSDSSGSTSLMSQYASTCGSGFGLGTGKTLSWGPTVKTADGTSGVLNLVAKTEGGITYASRGSPEVALANADGNFVTSSSASPPGDVSVPAPGGSWSDVSFINGGGNTHPISFAPFILTNADDGGEDVKGFLKTAYSSAVQGCAASQGFQGVTGSLEKAGAACMKAF
ncbi:hypothetical protein BSKO_12806 [Bryopsis sp. KO-2023]|nr:hypothetical protein BSKO_12806 [Bryopsis sp. KO-2023]